MNRILSFESDFAAVKATRRTVIWAMVTYAKTREAKRDINTRQHLSERSFARSKRYSFKRAR